MPEHSKQQHTGSEQLRRKIMIANLCTGVAAALWLIPIAVCLLVLRRAEIFLAMHVAGAIAMAALVVGLRLRAQRRNLQWQQSAESTARLRHQELLNQHAADNQAIARLIMHNHTAINGAVADVRRRIDDVAGKVSRDYFGVYADALTDLQGGPEVVNGEVTRRLYLGSPDNVVQFRAPNRSR